MSKKKINRKFTRTMQKKLAVLFVIILLALIGLNLRVTFISAKSGDKYKKQVLSQQQYDSRVVPYKRGDILDRNKTVLATSLKVYNLAIDCVTINEGKEYLEPTISALVEYLNVDETSLRELLTSDETSSLRYKVLRKEVSVEEKEAFEEFLNIPEDSEMSKEEKARRNNVRGVWFEDQYVRQYPNGTLASNLLGFSNSENMGNTGIEGSYNDKLNGTNGREYGYLNQDQEFQRDTIDPQNGYNLVSTIDVNIQTIAEAHIKAFDEKYKDGPLGYKDKGSETTSVIVADPKTMEIYAMADSNNYDLNNPYDLTPYYSEEEIAAMSEEDKVVAYNRIWKNFSISNTIELGSTFKPMTISAGLDMGAITENDRFFCDGFEIVADRRIRCSDVNGHGDESLGDVLANSCNDGIMQISRAMGADAFLRYQDIFNFGKVTGIDLQGEEQGMLHQEMSSVSLAIDSFGQGFTATMIQELAAFSSVINGGYYYQPHTVNKILDENGNLIKKIDPELVKQTVSKTSSDLVREYLKRGVAEGTGKTAQVPGYSMGGKTGTAERLPRDDGNYLVSFIGFAPVEDPKVVVYVVIDKPNVDFQANSKYAQELARDIFADILPYLNVDQTEEINAEDLVTNPEGQEGEDQAPAGTLPSGVEIGVDNSLPAPLQDDEQPPEEQKEEVVDQ